MCDPVTLLIGATAVSAVGSTVGAVMAFNQGSYQAKVARQNAQLADQASVDAIEQGKRETQLHYRRQSQLQGAQRAAMAANGLDLGFGSALDIQGDTTMIGREDADTIAQNAGRAAMGYSIEAANYRSQASAARMQGTAGLIGGLADASSTALSGASRAMLMRGSRTAPRRR